MSTTLWSSTGRHLERAPDRDVPRRPRLILAEDDDDIRVELEEIFAEDGFEVISVPDGFALIDRVERCRTAGRLPDVVVTDHRMPGCTSFELLERLREVSDGPPVIVITAFGAEIDELARLLGARAVFQKPFDPDDLRTAVLYVMREPPDAVSATRAAKGTEASAPSVLRSHSPTGPVRGRSRPA